MSLTDLNNALRTLMDFKILQGKYSFFLAYKLALVYHQAQ